MRLVAERGDEAAWLDEYLEPPLAITHSEHKCVSASNASFAIIGDRHWSSYHFGLLLICNASCKGNALSIVQSFFSECSVSS